MATTIEAQGLGDEAPVQVVVEATPASEPETKDAPTVRYKSVTTAVDAECIDLERKRIRFWLTTKDLDRDGEVILPEGVDFTNFNKNPVALFNHDTNQPIGSWEDMELVKGQGWRGWLCFGESKLAQDMWMLAKDGHLRAVSIGFLPKKLTKDKVFDDQKGSTIAECEAYEGSLVPVPSNPNALAKMLAIGEVAISTIDLLFPGAKAAAIAADPDEFLFARAKGDLKRVTGGAKAFKSYLQHLVKQLPESWGAERKAYFIRFAVRDSGLVEALQEVQDWGRIMEARFIPDEELEMWIQEDVDGDGEEDEYTDFGGRAMPGGPTVAEEPGEKDFQPGERGACKCGKEEELCLKCGECKGCCGCTTAATKGFRLVPVLDDAGQTIAMHKILDGEPDPKPNASEAKALTVETGAPSEEDQQDEQLSARLGRLETVTERVKALAQRRADHRAKRRLDAIGGTR